MIDFIFNFSESTILDDLRFPTNFEISYNIFPHSILNTEYNRMK